MMVLAVSVTSVPNGSLAGAGVAALGAGGGGPSGAGMDACPNADEATPSASSAARIASRIADQRQVIKISLDRKSAALPARREESVESTTAAQRRNNRKPVIVARVPGQPWPSFGHFPYKRGTFHPGQTMSALANRPFVK